MFAVQAPQRWPPKPIMGICANALVQAQLIIREAIKIARANMRAMFDEIPSLLVGPAEVIVTSCRTACNGAARCRVQLAGGGAAACATSLPVCGMTAASASPGK